MNWRPVCQKWRRLALQDVETRNFSHRVTLYGVGRAERPLRALPLLPRKLANVAASRAPMESTMAWLVVDVVDKDVEAVDEVADESEADCCALMAA